MLALQKWVLEKYFTPREDAGCVQDIPSPEVHSKLSRTFSTFEDIESLKSRRILDFGCGNGAECIELAQQGCSHVVGLDIRKSILAEAESAASHAGVSVRFTDKLRPDELFDRILSIDAFEHYSDPAAILRMMKTHLAPQGEVWISFGPPWYHPHGGHLFSFFPWSHLLFSEKALIHWRSRFRQDGATRFAEVDGGLNQMTLTRFRSLIQQSGFKTLEFKLVPISRLKPLASFLPKEFITSVVFARLS